MELLPTRDCEAGYTPGSKTHKCLIFCFQVSFLRSDDAVGLDESQAATIIFMCGIGEIAGKLVLIAIAGFLQSIPALYVAAFGNALSAVFTIGLLLCSSYVPAAIFVVCK